MQETLSQPKDERSGSNVCSSSLKIDTDNACHRICDHIVANGGTVKLNQHQYQVLAQMVLDVWENGHQIGTERALRKPDMRTAAAYEVLLDRHQKLLKAVSELEATHEKWIERYYESQKESKANGEREDAHDDWIRYERECTALDRMYQCGLLDKSSSSVIRPSQVLAKEMLRKSP